MALVVDPYSAVPGATIAASEINARIAAILTQVNGNLDATNLHDASVSKVKLAADALQAFLQLQTPASRKLAFGQSSYVFAGGAALGAFSFVDVPHGLGVVPAAVLALNANAFGDTDARLSVISTDATNIRIQGRATVGVGPGGAFPFHWAAIG